MKLNLDNKYHHQLPRGGETRRQRTLTCHGAHGQGPLGTGVSTIFGIRHLQSGPSQLVQSQPSGPATSQQAQGMREQAVLSRDQGQAPRKPPGAPDDHSSHPSTSRGPQGLLMTIAVTPAPPEAPRAGLLMTRAVTPAPPEAPRGF